MKIAQVCPKFYPHIGGVETHVYELSRRLSKRHELEVLTTDPSGKLRGFEEIDGFTVRRFKSQAPSDSYFFSLGLYRFLKYHSSDYDVVHAHNYHAFPSLFSALTKGKNRLVFTPHYHGKGHSTMRNALHKPYKPLGRTIFKRSDAILCVSRFERNLVLRDFRVGRVYVIPNGINVDEFKHGKTFKKSKGERVVLYVGRLEKYKGVDHIVKALSKLPKNFKLEIVGKGGYKRKIVELAHKLNVIDRICFYQDLSKSKLVERYATSDVLVLLSRHEAYGLVVAEALACKTPCVVANTSALSEWIDNKNVFGVDYPIRLEDLVDAILKAVNVRVKGVKLPTWDYVVRRLEGVYQDVVKK